MRSVRVVVLVVALSVAMGGVAPAQDPLERSATSGWSPDGHGLDGHDGTDTDVRAQRDNFRVLGHADFGRRGWADVFFYDYGGTTGKYAFVGHWGPVSFNDDCREKHVRIVNVNDPRNPRTVARIGNSVNVTREDLAVVRIGDRDVLSIGTQRCSFFGGGDAAVGLKLVDVTNPRNPRNLSLLEIGNEGAGAGVHELDVAVRPNGQALALLATPFTEQADRPRVPGDFRIVDITRPRRPVELADWSIIHDSDLKIFGGNDPISEKSQGLGLYPQIFAHSARAADDGRTAYVSYWDAGVLKFDLTDPENPELVARTPYGPGADGDAHSVGLLDLPGRRYILQNDEDMDPQPSVLVGTGLSAQQYPAQQQWWAPYELSRDAGVMTGRAFHAGNGCERGDFKGSHDKVVFVNAQEFGGGCRIGTKVMHALERQPTAVILNIVWPNDPNAFFPQPSQRRIGEIRRLARGIPILQMTDIDDVADSVRAVLDDRDIKVTLRAQIPQYGALRVFDESSASDINADGVEEYEQVGGFDDLPHVRGARKAYGPWSIHNTEAYEDRAYSSWYGHGIVALDVSDPAGISLVGQFVPPDALTWGVAVDPETGVVYASDINSGLWIVRPTNEAVATPMPP